MISFFTVPKPFIGEDGIHQRNALESWVRLTPCPEITLIGDETGVDDAAQQFGAHHVTQVKRNQFGTPLLDDIFRIGELHASYDLMAYINTDVIIAPESARVFDYLGSLSGNFLAVGARYDVELHTYLDFNEGWDYQLYEMAYPHELAAVDYLFFRRKFWRVIPPFALGRYRWDNWLLWWAINRDYPTIDLSDVFIAIHQNHGYAHAPNIEQEFQINDRLVADFGGQLARIYDTTWIMCPDGSLKVRSHG